MFVYIIVCSNLIKLFTLKMKQNFNITVQSIMPVKFDPLNKELPVRNARFVFTPLFIRKTFL